MTTFQTPVRCEAFPDSGKTGRVCISGSRKTISCQGCSSLCVTAQGAFKPVRRDCLSPRRRDCDTSGSPLPIYRTEPAQAALCLAKTRLTCIFNNFARHSPTHYFPDQNSHLVLRDR